MNYLSTLMGLLLSVTVWAQHSIQGVVIDRAEKPVPFAPVALLNSKDSSVVKGTLTDETGRFTLTGIDQQEALLLSIQYIGYDKFTSSLPALTPDSLLIDLGKITLAEASKTLEEVNVKGQRSLIEQRPDRIILTVENSVITKGNKVNDLLKYVPLVRQTSSGEIQVANKKNVLILVDGRHTGQASLNNFLQNFSAEDILKIEVITNPSARYDAGSGAVINIITRKSLEVGLNGRFALTHSQGQYGRSTSDGTINYRSEKWNLFGSVSGNRSDHFYDQILNRTFVNSTMENRVKNVDGYTTGSTFLGMDFTPNSNHTLGVRINGNWGKTQTATSTKTSFFNRRLQPDSLLQTQNQGSATNQTYDFNLNYTGKLDSAGRDITVNVTQTLFSRNSLQQIEYQMVSSDEVLKGSPTRLRIINPSQQGNFIAQADIALPGKKARWDLGAKYIYIGNDNELRLETLQNGRYQLDSSFSNLGIYREYTVAGYSNFSPKLEKGWSLQAGLRVERTSQELTNTGLRRTYAGLFPSVSVSRTNNADQSWGVTFSRRISRPNLSNLVPFRTVIDPYSVSVGNPNLKPQFSNSADAYINRGSWSFFGNYTFTRDFITDILYANTETKVYTQLTANLENVHEIYTGVNWSHNIKKWWQTTSNLTLSGTNISTPIAEVPQLRASGYGVVINSTNIFTLPKEWKLEASFSYNSANRWTVWVTRSLFNSSISLNKLILKNGNLRITAEDLFRSQINRLQVAYGVVNITSRIYNDTQRVRLSFSYNFGKKTVKESRQRGLGNEAEKNRIGGK